MKKKISIILGVFALILAVGLNVRHAMNDYGVKESKLHIEALARTNGEIKARYSNASGSIQCCKPDTSDTCNGGKDCP